MRAFSSICPPTVVGMFCVMFPSAPNVTPEALIEDARRLAPQVEASIWPGFADGPFRVLLVGETVERLYCADGRTPDGFAPTDPHPQLDCDAHVRPRQFDPTFLASFPLQDGVPTILIGTPSATGKTPKEWVVTVLHEHLHQQQFAWPSYFATAMALDLHGGDDTGMWQLNYPFPYEEPAVAAAARAMAEAAADAVEARESPNFEAALQRHRAARVAFAAAISAADLRYYDLQAWQEGTARYVERAAAALWDAHSSTEAAETAALIDELRALDLAEQKRIAFYALGAAEAVLLDAAQPGWKSAYYDGRLTLAGRLEAD